MIPRPLSLWSFLVLCAFAAQPVYAAGRGGFAGGVASPPRGFAGAPAGARQASPGSFFSPAQQSIRPQFPAIAPQFISPGGFRQLRILPFTPGRFPAPPFRFNHDFRRHHRFHVFPPFVSFPVSPFFGPAFVTGPFVTTVPYSPYTVSYSPYAVPYSPYATSTSPYVVEMPRGDVDVRGYDRLAPFDPTPEEVVDRMLALAGVHKGDLVYDLGAGDGRMVIAAAKKYGVRAVGFEVDPGLAKLARENVRKQGVESLVEIREQDFMNIDLSPTTVVTLYLSQDGNLALRSKLLKELKPDARVVSYTFDMGDWQPRVVESYRDAGGDRHMLYLWQMSKPMLFSNEKH